MDLIAPGHGLMIWQFMGAFLAIAYAVFWIYALVDLLKSEFRAPQDKLIWALVLIFTNPVGIFLYLSMSRSHKEKWKFEPDFSRKRYQ